MASCQPLATALDNGQVILCDRIADPWVGIPALHGGPAPRLPKPLQSPGAAPALPARLSSAASPCRTPSGSAWDAAPSSSSPTSSSPSDSPNTSAPSATGSCERQAGTGGTHGDGGCGLLPDQPPVLSSSPLQLYGLRGDLSLPHPPCHGAQALGRGSAGCGAPGAATSPCPALQELPQTRAQALQGSGSLCRLSGLWIPLTSLPRCPLGSGVLPERGAPRRSGSPRHLFLGGLPEPG